MFNSTILDVVVGLIFTFLAISLAASAITEAFASAFKWRSQTLLTGIKDLLNDQNFSGLAKELYNHALVNPRESGKIEKEEDVKKAPAYIDPKQFAAAFLETIHIAQGTRDAVNVAVGSVSNDQLRNMLSGMVKRTDGDLDRMQNELAGWFDNAMDRVSGAYKRKAQLWSFIIALLVTVSLNADAIQVGKALWQQPMVTKAIDAKPGLKPEDVRAQFDELKLPVGWTVAKLQALLSDSLWIEAVIGWLVTASATLFGAAFWFDMLQSVARLKGSGPSPAEKQKSLSASA
jgi:hypothetical protein